MGWVWRFIKWVLALVAAPPQETEDVEKVAEAGRATERDVVARPDKLREFERADPNNRDNQG